MSNDDFNDASIADLAKDTVVRLTDLKRTVATAESCTGGWIAKSLTDVAGSSVVFDYGVVSYSNDAKTQLLGVSDDALAKHGAVSEAAVREMAEGALRMSGADYAVAVSGIAGPGGGSDEKPVGTVWFAWAVRDSSKLETTAVSHHLDGDRDAVRRQTVVKALQGLDDRIVGDDQ